MSWLRNLSPVSKSIAITPTNDLAITPTVGGIHVGTAGNIVGILDGDTVARTFYNVSGYLPYVFKEIKSTNTTAQNIIGFVR